MVYYSTGGTDDQMRDTALASPKTRLTCPAGGTNCDGSSLTVVGDATYLIQQPMDLARSTSHAVVTLPTDYTVSFEITPQDQVQPGWASIVHFSATGNDCCNSGDRIPGIWFH